MSDSNQIIGMKKGSVTLVKHDRKWDTIAKKTIGDIKNILGDLSVAIEHIGSTSIKNIYAKPIIDIVVGLGKLNDILEENIICELEKYGYVHDPEYDNSAKIFFFKSSGELITHNIHAVVYKEKAWNCYTKLRDYLNKHDDVALKYQDIKIEQLKNCHHDISKYHDGKAEFLKEITVKALKTIK